jgi:BirA family biotin operon repressor/biotin-[acetyl-CoA-carboxylase] ligase
MGATRPGGPNHLGVEPGRVLDGGADLGLSTDYVAARLHYLRSVGSTNAVLTGLAEDGAPSGEAVLAEEQTGGRGRLGRAWHSPEGGGLWLSVLLRTDLPAEKLAPLSIAVAVGVGEALRELTGLDVRVKWPNDILVGGKKLGGVLVESTRAPDAETTSVVVGLGLNVNTTAGDMPPELEELATSLRESVGRELDRLEVLRAVVTALEDCFDEFLERGIGSLRERWRDLSTLRGLRVTLNAGSEGRTGTVVDMADSGALILEMAGGGTEEVWHGDITPVAADAGGIENSQGTDDD